MPQGIQTIVGDMFREMGIPVYLASPVRFFFFCCFWAPLCSNQP